ncbi:MAG TPA: site-2 protease family protein [Polyangia bacterium]|nr:site-2 protease family protein [Polyangia bacterium]
MTASGVSIEPRAPRVCVACGAQIAEALLACPSCGQLVHAAELKQLAAEAARFETTGDARAALEKWRRMLELLPAQSTQHARVLAKVQALSDAVAGAQSAGVAQPSSPGGASRSKKAVGIGTVGVMLAKFKWVILALLGKGKVLLVGLAQAKTFLSMGIALAVYASFYGWKFGLGLIASIYVHEMGHVFWLRRYGIAATAPMFIPGFGAFVRLKQHPATVGEDARVGLAGPVWGAAAALAALALGAAFDKPIFFTIARIGAWINIFNLIPIWQLDGGRGFAALSRGQRGLVAAVCWALALSGADGMMYLLAIAASFRAAGKGNAPAVGDRSVLATYLALIVGLTALMVAAHHGAGDLPGAARPDRAQRAALSV